MPPSPIIIGHPPVNSKIKLSLRRECVTIIVFVFEDRPERLRARIIPTHTGPADRLTEPGFPAFVGHVAAGELTTPIGMKDGARDTATAGPDGHVQTINDQFGTHMIGRRPAQRPLGMLVPDR